MIKLQKLSPASWPFQFYPSYPPEEIKPRSSMRMPGLMSNPWCAAAKGRRGGPKNALRLLAQWCMRAKVTNEKTSKDVYSTYIIDTPDRVRNRPSGKLIKSDTKVG